MLFILLLLLFCFYQIIVVSWSSLTQRRLRYMLYLLNIEKDYDKQRILLSFCDHVSISSIRYNINIPITFETMAKHELWIKYPSDQTFSEFVYCINLAFYRNVIKPTINAICTWFQK